MSDTPSLSRLLLDYTASVWGAFASEHDAWHLACKLDDREPVEISVLTAEKRYDWYMSILKAPKGGPLLVVQELIIKK